MTQLTTPAKADNDFRSMLVAYKDQIAMALPRHMTAERMVRMANTIFSRTPGLQECSPLSIFACVLQAAELGLELSGPLGQAYLVPRKNKNTNRKEATFQIGYRGLQELAYRSGRITSFPAHEVREKDSFDYSYGTSGYLKHKPARGDRGALTHFYAVLNFKAGGADFEVMSVEDVNEHRAKYSQNTSGFNNPWETAYPEMGKKTVIRRLSKRSPVSVELVKAAVIDEYGEAGLPQDLVIDMPAVALPAPDGNGNQPVGWSADILAKAGVAPASQPAAPVAQPTTPALSPDNPQDLDAADRSAAVAAFRQRIPGCTTSLDLDELETDLMRSGFGDEAMAGLAKEIQGQREAVKAKGQEALPFAGQTGGKKRF